MDRIDVWIGDKRKPELKETTKGKVLEIQCLQQTEAYDAWIGGGKTGTPPDRYLAVTVSFWGEEFQLHAQKIYDKAMALKEAKDPRPHMHAIGKWGKSREYNSATCRKRSGVASAEYAGWECNRSRCGTLTQRRASSAPSSLLTFLLQQKSLC